MYNVECQRGNPVHVYRLESKSWSMCNVFFDSNDLMFYVISLLFREKVLVLYLLQAMLALTACQTSWSTSLSIMDFASTSSVLVSVSCMKMLFLSLSSHTKGRLICFNETQAFPQDAKQFAQYLTHLNTFGLVSH